MATAKKLPSGSWRVQVLAGYDASGKKIQKSFTAPTKWEAEKMADEYKRYKKEKPTDKKVGKIIDEYIEIKSNVLSPTTIRGYKAIRATRLQTVMGEKLSRLTATDIHDADNKIISILSICASSIQLEETKSTSVFPAVELKLFGVDHNYQGKKIAPDNEAKYSELIFNWLISYIKSEICERINVEYLVLFSVPDNKTIGFYNKMGLKKLKTEMVWSAVFFKIGGILWDDRKKKNRHIQVECIGIVKQLDIILTAHLSKRFFTAKNQKPMRRELQMNI